MNRPPSPPSGISAGPLGFVQGVLSVVRGLSFIARAPGARPLALVPIVAFVVLSVLGVCATFHELTTLLPMIEENLDLSSTELGRFGARAAQVLVAVLSGVLGVLAGMVLTPVVSAPALERLILLRERDLGVPPRPPVSFLRELGAGFRAQVLAAVVGTIVLGALALITLIVPPLAVVTFPLKFAVGQGLLAWNLLDYPLSLRGMSLSARLRFLRSEATAATGFALGATLLFFVPLGAIVFLPVAVVAATEIGARAARD